MISTIRKGYTLTVNGDVYLVAGSRLLRGRQFYIVKDTHGRKCSIKREQVLSGQQDGSVSVKLETVPFTDRERQALSR